jgi:zinc and cadmium transporter
MIESSSQYSEALMLMAWIISFSLLGSVGALAGAALLLVFPEIARRKLVPNLISFASGTLLGAAFLCMIPAGIRAASAQPVLLTVLAGMVLFFILEKLVLWRHCHESDCEVHGQAAPLILIGDALHNFVDGIVIAAAFLTSVSLGITATIAIIAHEIPQEVGDFAILLDSGLPRVRALVLNGLSAAATLPGAMLAYFWLAETSSAMPHILALSASSFIYIATADLIPSLHSSVSIADSTRQTLLLILGIVTIALMPATRGI